ncbi:hypothetical protein AMECASPLE_011665 [Ameca splendens]|uniref:Uncharacterized protein n=1 Tax=Ameca splendens TaxID=208324 RepID=A0ABV0YC00_9TELE
MGPLHSEEFSAYIKEPGDVWDIALGTGPSRSSCLSGKEKNMDINVKAENKEHVCFSDRDESFWLGLFHLNWQFRVLYSFFITFVVIFFYHHVDMFFLNC